MKLIGFGKSSKYTYYILIYFLCSLTRDCVVGFNNRDHRISIFNFFPGISRHLIARNILIYISSFFCGIILYLLRNQIEMKKKGEISLEKQNKIREKYLGEKGESINLLLIIIFFIYSLNDLIRSMLYPSLSSSEFWMLEIAFIVILTSKILKVKIGIHQKITVFVVAGVLFFFRIINFLLPLTKHTDCGNVKCKDRFINDNNLFYLIKTLFGNYYYTILIFIIFTLIAIMRDYSWVKTKYLLDVKTVPFYKIFIFYGLVGVTTFFIAGIILTYIPCETILNVKEKYNSKLQINDYYNYNNDINNNETRIIFTRYKCRVKDFVEKNSTSHTGKLKLYYDNYFVFSDFYKEFNKNNKKEIFVIIPLYILFQGIINFSEIMMISHFDPNIILISRNFFYFIQRIIQFWVNKADEQYLTHIQFIILELEEFISLVSNMIYLEIIELRFCNLNYDTKRLIQERMDLDFNIMEDEEESNNRNNSCSIQSISFSET